MQIRPGHIQDLPVWNNEEKMILLGDDRLQVPISRRELSRVPEPGETVRVFTFFNEKQELEATTQLPAIEVGGLGSFRVISVNDIGAFISIGTRRDILIPRREQREPLEPGRMALVTLRVDYENRRLFGSTKVTSWYRNNRIELERGDEVEMVIADKLEIGRRVIIDEKYVGLLFRQEMVGRIQEGMRLKGYVRKIEGKDITVSMQKEGEALLEDSVARLLEFLEANKGYVRLNDDSDPEEIRVRLRMSKKAFKKAVGILYKQRKVELTRFGVKLVKNEAPPEPPKPVRRTTGKK